MRLGWAVWVVGSVALCGGLSEESGGLPSCEGETEEQRAAQRPAANRTRPVRGGGGGTCNRSLAPGDSRPCHYFYTGLLKAQPAQFGWRTILDRASFLNQIGGMRNVHRIKGILEINQVIVTACSFAFSLIVHFDKENKKETKSFFYNFLLWDLGLQLVVFLPRVIYGSDLWHLLPDEDDRCQIPSTVDGVPLEYTRINAKDCDAGYWAMFFMNPRSVVPSWAPRWTDLVICLDRCVGLGWPAWYKAHFSDPAMPARRRALPVFAAFLLYTHQLLQSARTGRGSFSHTFIFSHYTLLQNGLVRQTMFNDNYEHCESGTKFTLYYYFTLEFLPAGLKVAAFEFVNSYSFGINTLLWLYLGLKLYKLRRQESAAQAAKEDKNLAALQMTVVVFSFDAFIHSWTILYDIIWPYRDSAFKAMRSSSDPDQVEQARTTFGRIIDIQIIKTLADNLYCLNLVFLLAFSGGYRRMAGRAVGKWRLVRWAKARLAKNSVQTIPLN